MKKTHSHTHKQIYQAQHKQSVTIRANSAKT